VNRIPNIFSFATSELSQDAFICWLISWANPTLSEIDSDLNVCAQNFVRALVGKQNLQINSIEVGRQWKNIDIWAIVNDDFFIVIEDKKGTKEHSNQLTRYKEIAIEKHKNKEIGIVLVYFKMEEQGNLNAVKNAGYSIFTRGRMLKILNPYFRSQKGKSGNNILMDYHSNLVELDEQINSFRTLPLNKWYWYSWQGFYSELLNHFDGDWNYVANAAGGFLGFWWHWKYGDIEGRKFDLYLQLEQDKLIIKLHPYEKQFRNELKNLVRKPLFELSKKHSLDIHRSGRIGTYMGIAKYSGNYRVTFHDGTLDFDATVKLLKKFMNLLDDVENEIKAHNRR
jgi:hypothetical protein